MNEGPEVVNSFLLQFYAPGKYIPSVIIAPHDVDDILVTEVLTERRTAPVRIAAPLNTQEKKLLDIARNVARQARERKDTISARLRKVLKLADEPLRIECIDASHLAGQKCVSDKSCSRKVDATKKPRAFIHSQSWKDPVTIMQP